MAGKRSAARKAKRLSKDAIISEMSDHILETYHPLDGAVVLMWRECMNGFYGKTQSRWSPWVRDGVSTHQHWLQYGRKVKKELECRGLVAVSVSGDIRELVKHGAAPTRSERCNDAAYRRCLSSSRNPTQGMVLFPRDTHQDHPLIVASLDRRGKSSANGFSNAVGAMDKAKDMGSLSNGQHREIRGHCVTIARRGLRRSIGAEQPLLRGLDPSE